MHWVSGPLGLRVGRAAFFEKTVKVRVTVKGKVLSLTLPPPPHTHTDITNLLRNLLSKLVMSGTEAQSKKDKRRGEKIELLVCFVDTPERQVYDCSTP